MKLHQVGHPPALPEDRGRLISAQEIGEELFRGSRSADWVKRVVCPEGRLTLGHSTVRWWEYDVLKWIQEQSGEAA